MAKNSNMNNTNKNKMNYSNREMDETSKNSAKNAASKNSTKNCGSKNDESAYENESAR